MQMENLKPHELKPLLASYDRSLVALDETLRELETAGLVTVSRKSVAKARRLVDKHLSAIERGAFGHAQEQSLVYQIDDTMDIGSFSSDSAFENPRGRALKAFAIVEQAYEVLHRYIFG
jgi:hypothetical protein